MLNGVVSVSIENGMRHENVNFLFSWTVQENKKVDDFIFPPRERPKVGATRTLGFKAQETLVIVRDTRAVFFVQKKQRKPLKRGWQVDGKFYILFCNQNS